MTAVKARTIGVQITLPKRNTPAERVTMLESDIRDAAEQARAKLRDAGSKHHNGGWSTDEEGWQMASIGDRSILVTMRMTRPA